jgi:hypothetical protein
MQTDQAIRIPERERSDNLADDRQKDYVALPTCLAFHNSKAQLRAVVGPVGSGKTSAASWEICWFLPEYLYRAHGYTKSRWVIVRNTYLELADTTRKTIEEWFPFGTYMAQARTYFIRYGDPPIQVELLYRSCDRPEDIKKFKSLELTGYWIDESIEVKDEIKLMLQSRIGRYPRGCKVRYGIETTNPPDITDATYYKFNWQQSPPGHPGPILPPGPLPTKDPLEKHEGFWQPPRENIANLRPGYYDDLRQDYADNPDWIDMYIDGKPGILVKGKLVYSNFRREIHCAKEPLRWTGGPLYLGWDHSGNTPACVVVQIPTSRSAQVLREYYSDKMGIVDFGRYVLHSINRDFPGWEAGGHFGDPAGAAAFSKKDGGFTSNHQLLLEECGVEIVSADNNFRARVEAVERQLRVIDGLLLDPSCILTINGFLGGYYYPENQQVMGEYLPNVRKNRYSHVHDALQYCLMSLFSAPVRDDLEPAYLAREDRESAQYNPLDYWG